MAAARVTKILRIDLSLAERILKENPKLKMIHLFRDPRAIINSHLRTGWFPLKDEKHEEDLVNDIKVCCRRMQDDIYKGTELLRRFPKQFKIIQYEDVIYRTLKKSSRLYAFIGMKMSKYYDEFVYNVSQQESDKFTQGAIGEFTYRKTLSWKTIRKIDYICRDVLAALGYKEYPSRQHLINMSFIHLNSPLPFSL